MEMAGPLINGLPESVCATYANFHPLLRDRVRPNFSEFRIPFDASSNGTGASGVGHRSGLTRLRQHTLTCTGHALLCAFQTSESLNHQKRIESACYNDYAEENRLKLNSDHMESTIGSFRGLSLLT